MRLSAPTFGVFLISIVLAILVVATRYGGVSVPYVNGHGFEVLGAAYIVMLIGVLFKRL